MFNQEDTVNFYREGSIRFRDLRWFNPYIPMFQSLTFLQAKNDFHHQPHRHDFHEFIIPEDDHYRCLLNGREIAVGRNEILLVQYGDLHEDVLSRGCRFNAIMFDLKLQEPTLKTAGIFRHNLPPSEQKIAVPTTGPVRETFRLMCEECPNFFPTTYNILNGLFQSLFWQIIRSYPDSVFLPAFSKTSSREAFKNDLLKIFDDNLNSKLNVGEIARRMKMSESSIAHKCRDYFDMPPAQAFLHYKFKKAEPFVRHSQLTMKEISDMFGFENQFHFSRRFKKIYGMSPIRYRIHKKEYP